MSTGLLIYWHGMNQAAAFELSMPTAESQLANTFGAEAELSTGLRTQSSVARKPAPLPESLLYSGGSLKRDLQLAGGSATSNTVH